jgi:hypothetical protein
MNAPFSRLAVLSGLALFLAAVPVDAQALTAEEIIEQSTGQRSVDNSIQTMTMTIVDKSERSRVRRITSKVKTGEDGRSRSYVRFIEPTDVEGVQFLTIENPGGEDDQWLYMPAGGVLNRISGSSKKGSFMGSDFTFEDLSVGGNVDDGVHTLQGEEDLVLDGQTYGVYKVQTVPKPEVKSAYSRFVTYITRDELMPRRVEFFDKNDVMVKRMTLHDIEKDGEVRFPKRTIMENLKRGTRTEVQVDEYRLNVPAEELPDTMFTPDFLQSEG